MKSRRQKSVNHPTSECSKLVQLEYKGRQDNVTLYMHWQMCGKAGLAIERVVQNESLKVLWGFNVKCDRMFEARGPDIDFMNKQAMEAKIIDIAILGDPRE